MPARLAAIQIRLPGVAGRAGKIPPTPSLRDDTVPINAVCPECKTRFRLQDAMAGKLMRCASCQEMFTVTRRRPGRRTGPPIGQAPAAPTPRRGPAPTPRRSSPGSGNVSDFVPVHPRRGTGPAAATAPPAAGPAARRRNRGRRPGSERASSRRPPPTSRGTTAASRRRRPAPKEMAWAPDCSSRRPPPPPVDLEPMVDVDDLDGPEQENEDEPSPAARGPTPTALPAPPGRGRRAAS